jgi:hypothetical protein
LRQPIRVAVDTDSDKGGMRISIEPLLRSYAAPIYIM